MAYYEFYKIPGGSADKKGRTGDNPWSEIGNDDNIFIKYKKKLYIYSDIFSGMIIKKY